MSWRLKNADRFELGLALESIQRLLTAIIHERERETRDKAVAKYSNMVSSLATCLH